MDLKKSTKYNKTPFMSLWEFMKETGLMVLKKNKLDIAGSKVNMKKKLKTETMLCKSGR